MIVEVYTAQLSPSGGRWRRTLTHCFSLNLSFVEVSVTSTGSTSESFTCPFNTTCHELPATIHSIPSNISSMIFLALSIFHTPNTSWRFFWSSHYYLTLPHVIAPQKILLFLLQNPAKILLKIFLSCLVNEIKKWQKKK